PGGPHEEPESRLVLATQERGADAEYLLDRIEEIVAIRRVSRCARRRHTHARHVVRGDDLLVIAQHCDRARDRVGIEAPALVDTLAQPRDPSPAFDGREPGITPRTFHVGDEEPDRVRPDVDRGHAAHDAESAASAAAT